MSEFENLIGASVSEAAGVMGELFTHDGKQVRGIFSELLMDLGAESYGDTEEATAEIVIPTANIAGARRGDTIKRLKDGVSFKVISIDSVMGSVTLKVKRKGKLNG